MSTDDNMVIDSDKLDHGLGETNESRPSGISAARLFLKDEQLSTTLQCTDALSDLREEGDRRLCAYSSLAEASSIKQQSQGEEDVSIQSIEIRSTSLIRELPNSQAHSCRAVWPSQEGA